MRIAYLLISCAVLASAAQAQKITWLTDYEQALQASRRTGRPILADFTGSDWCVWCQKLDEQVFSTDRFATWASRKVVLLKVDFPRKKRIAAKLRSQNRKLSETYGIRGLPTVIFIDSKGKEIGRTGYVEGGASAWIADAEVNMQKSPWLTDYDQALRKARATRKPVLVNFTGSDWCEWCHRIKKEVFGKKEFVEWAKANVVLLELDFPRSKQMPKELRKQNEKIQKKFGITRFPTILFLDGRGEKIGQLGYKAGGPEAWIRHATAEMKKSR